MRTFNSLIFFVLTVILSVPAIAQFDDLYFDRAKYEAKQKKLKRIELKIKPVFMKNPRQMMRVMMNTTGMNLMMKVNITPIMIMHILPESEDFIDKPLL